MAKKSAKITKPIKPYPEFPLFPHATKRWAKKIRGKTEYFGRWDNPDAAVAEYLANRDRLQAGLPRIGVSNSTPADTSLTMRNLVNQFLNSKRRLMENSELSRRMHHDYYANCELVLDLLGRDTLVDTLKAEAFETLRASMAKGVGLVTLGNRIRMARVLFKYGYDADLMDKPIKFGPGFKTPSKKLLRADRQSKPKRMFEAEEIRSMIDAADSILKAMILLGINSGFGQTDCSSVPKSAFDLDKGWVTYPRPKTAVERRCHLWRETVTAMRAATAARPKAKREEFEERAFLTKYGVPFVRSGSVGSVIDGVAQQFRKLLIELKLNGNRRAFYALRHTFETIGGGSRDQIAVDHIMGHSPASDDMSATYREQIEDDRLKAVAEHVRKWLWPKPPTKKAKLRID
jgi:integrase